MTRRSSFSTGGSQPAAKVDLFRAGCVLGVRLHGIFVEYRLIDRRSLVLVYLIPHHCYILAAGLTLGFFHGARDVDRHGDGDFRVQADLDWMLAKRLDRPVEQDLRAA